MTSADQTRPDVRLVTDAAALVEAVRELRSAPVIGLDCETTGLDPHGDRLRLIQLAARGCVCLVDCFRVRPCELARLFQGPGAPLIVAHNAKFDLQFLMAAGLPVPPRLFDTMLAAQILAAGTPEARQVSLADVAARYLGETVDKSEQTSDWSGELTAGQLEYAAHDAAILLRLYDALREELRTARLGNTAGLENRALPAVAWMEHTGIGFDAERWLELGLAAERRRDELARELTATAGAEDLFGNSTVNWASPEQVAEVLRRRGHEVTSTDEATLRSIQDREPLVPLILAYREASKRVGTYGERWAEHVHARTGRIHASWRQIGAASGRMACTRPNLQNLPRDPAYRSCFRPGAGRVFVKADYSQIELRIAAEIAKDRRMIEAFQRGEDLHTLTARLVLGREAVTPEDRQAAKALNFGLLYGMGVQRFRDYAELHYGVQLSLEEAAELRRAWFRTYPGVRRWHRAQPDGEAETRTLGGRKRIGVKSFTEKLNTPVQGTGADGLKAALALLWTTRDRCPSAVPVLVVHDEIVLECDVAEAEQAAVWLSECMRQGMAQFLRRVPVDVETKIIADYGGTPATVEPEPDLESAPF